MDAAWGITIVRIIVGLTFTLHGLQKLFIYKIGGVTGAMKQVGLPLPRLSALLATCAELFGGLALIAGFHTQVAAIPLAFTMLVAILAVHLKEGYFGPKGYEYTLVLFAACVALIFTGPGALAIN